MKMMFCADDLDKYYPENYFPNGMIAFLETCGLLEDFFDARGVRYYKVREIVDGIGYLACSRERVSLENYAEIFEIIKHEYASATPAELAAVKWNLRFIHLDSAQFPTREQ